MRVAVVTAPQPVVTLDEAKAHLRVDGSAEDDLITGMVAAATGHLDGPAGWLGRAIGVQTLEVRGDLFWPGGVIELPYPPVTSVTSVKYLDSAGVEQTLAPAAYEVRDAVIVPAWSTSWPSGRLNGDGVRVRYQAGYAVLPASIRAAILLITDDLYNNRGTVETGQRAAAVAVPMSASVEMLLAPFRVWR